MLYGPPNPIEAEMAFKRSISTTLRSKAHFRCQKTVASEVMRKKAFRVVEVPEGQEAPVAVFPYNKISTTKYTTSPRTTEENT